MKLTHSLIFLSFSITSLVFAQQPDERSKPKHHISVACVGSLSDYAIKANEGAKSFKDSHIAATDENALPPSNLALLIAKKKSSSTPQEKHKELNLAINSPSEYLAIPSSTCRIKRFKLVEDKKEYTNYASVKLPKKPGPYTVILTRPVNVETWDNPSVTLLNDNLNSFPEGALRVLNITDRSIVVKINGKSVRKLEPKQRAVFQGILSSEKPVSFAIAYRHKDRVAYLMRKTFGGASSQRKTITCYYAPKKKRTPIRASTFTARPFNYEENN